MTRALPTLAALILVGFATVNGAPRANSQTGPGWIQLFDGKTLNGWTPMNDEVNWRVEDGAIVADKKKGKGNPSLVSNNSYKDFEIYTEFWVSDDANSGIYIRCTDPKNISSRSSHEVNIYDLRPDPTYGTGAIVDVGQSNAQGWPQMEYIRNHGQRTNDDYRAQRRQNVERQRRENLRVDRLVYNTARGW